MPPDFGGLLAKSKAPAIPGAKGLATPALEEPEDPAPDDDAGLMERITPIAQDFLDAMRGGDAAGVAEALIAAHKAIAAGPSEAGPELLEVED